MQTLLITLIIITAIFLILITFLQSSKKEGMGNSLGNMGANQIIGVKKTSDLLEQITWGLLTVLFTLSLNITFFLKNNKKKISISPNLERLYSQDLLTEDPIQETTDLTTKSPDTNSK